MFKKIIFILLLPCLSFAASPTDLLQKQLSRFQSMKANFSQKVMSDDGVVMQHATGFMKIVRPGKFLWQTNAPTKQTIVTDGHTVWIYDPDLQQVIVRNLQQSVTKTPMMLLTQTHLYLSKTFKIQQKQTNGAQTFILEPNMPDELFKQVTLTFQDNRLQSMSFSNQLGQTTEIQFSAVTINPMLNADRFHFVIPEGVDVVKE